MTIVVAILALPAVASKSASPRAETAEATQSCSLTVTRKRVGSRLARKTVEIRARCNYKVFRIGFRASMAIGEVRRTPTLVGATPADRLFCNRKWPFLVTPPGAKPGTLGGCTGVAGANTRTTITVTLKRMVCRPKRLRVRVKTFGGPASAPDCTGSLPCAEIAYTASIAKNVTDC